MSWLRFDGADHLCSRREFLEREGWGEGRLGAGLPSSPPGLLASLSALPLILKTRGWHTATVSTWANYIFYKPRWRGESCRLVVQSDSVWGFWALRFLSVSSSWSPRGPESDLRRSGCLWPPGSDPDCPAKKGGLWSSEVSLGFVLQRRAHWPSCYKYGLPGLTLDLWNQSLHFKQDPRVRCVYREVWETLVWIFFVLCSLTLQPPTETKISQKYRA